MSEMDFRQFDPAIGRFNVPDRLAEYAYGITPYRFAFNNPIIFSDPTGLFETRREAREYRRDNGISGGRIRKQEDGSFALEGKGGYHFQAGDDSGASHDLFPNDGVVQSVLVTADKSDIADKRSAQINRLKHDLQIQKDEFQWSLIGNGKSPYVTINSRMQAIGNFAEIATIVTAPVISATSKSTVVAANGVDNAVTTVSELSPYALEITHGLTQSKKQFQTIKASIESEGITESIKYVIWQGTKFVVDGHHRLRAAKELGITKVPVQEVQLPYAGYKTVDDLIYTKY